MKICIIDFETQDGNSKTTNFTEIGAVLYDVQDREWKELESISALAYEPSYTPQQPFIVELTGITDEMLKAEGRPRYSILNEFAPIMEKADLLIAHKVSFDKTVLFSNAERVDVTLPKKEWFCSLTDFPWAKKFTCHKLSHLAYEHGILVDPRTLHRATDDVKLLQRLLAEYDFLKVYEGSKTPWIYLEAHVCGPWEDNGLQNSIAKGLGFSWETPKGLDNPKFPKKWVKRVKEYELADIKKGVTESASPFRVTKIPGFEP